MKGPEREACGRSDSGKEASGAPSTRDLRLAIHPVAAEGFERAVDAYERGRPAYPAEAVAAVLAEVGLPAADAPRVTLLDLGAGTGKLTRMLVPYGARVLAIEPVAGMRRKLGELVPAAEALDGTAEAIPLPDGSVSAVTVGQAFHWFDSEQALAEIHRVLAPGGRLALLWNMRDQGVGWVQRLSDILDRARGSRAEAPPHYASMAWQRAFDDNALFTPLVERRFRHEQAFDAVDRFVDRVASISFVAALDVPDRERVLREVRELCARQTPTSARPLRLPYETLVYTCARRDTAEGAPARREAARDTPGEPLG